MNNWIVIKHPNEISSMFTPYGYERMMLKNVTAFYSRDGRFTNDQVFMLNADQLLILDGVILNRKELEERFHVGSITQLVETLDKEEDLFFESFIGPFCGIKYSATTDLLTAFGNQTGDASIFYYCGNGMVILSNDMNLIIDALRAHSIAFTLNEGAAMYIMSFGYMIDDSTLISEIKRIMPGHYLSYSSDKMSIKQYYHYENDKGSLSKNEAIELIDQTFRRAVQRCFDKDLEYGYRRHLADMSGGLDSRMVSWVARDMGYSDILNISYSQANSDEHKYAMQVANYLNNDFLHMQLDSARFLYDIDEIVAMEYGLASYYGITGGNTLLRSIDFNIYGLEHTGQLGDVLLGTYTQKAMPVNTPYKRYSTLLDVNIDPAILEQYKDLEDFLISTRGFLGILSTHLIRRHYTYAVSPFLDVDFMNVCMRIPLEMKREQKIYWEWIDQKYPEAGKFISTRKRPEEKIALLAKKISRKAIKECRKIMLHMGLVSAKADRGSMNPLQYWYDTKPDIRTFIEKYYNDNRSLLELYQTTGNAIDEMTRSSSVTDKLLALTVIASVRLFFGDSNERTIRED